MNSSSSFLLSLSNRESRRLRPPTWKVGGVVSFHVEILPPTSTGNGGKSLCHHSCSPPLATHHHQSPTNTNPHRTTTLHLEPAPMPMAIAIIRRRRRNSPMVPLALSILCSQPHPLTHLICQKGQKVRYQSALGWQRRVGDGCFSSQVRRGHVVSGSNIIR